MNWHNLIFEENDYMDFLKRALPLNLYCNFMAKCRKKQVTIFDAVKQAIQEWVNNDG